MLTANIDTCINTLNNLATFLKSNISYGYIKIIEYPRFYDLVNTSIHTTTNLHTSALALSEILKKELPFFMNVYINTLDFTTTKTSNFLNEMNLLSGLLNELYYLEMLAMYDYDVVVLDYTNHLLPYLTTITELLSTLTICKEVGVLNNNRLVIPSR